ncbi:MAG: hypothetical protein ABI461_21225, partial [Polyangiaceae bacterium]
MLETSARDFEKSPFGKYTYTGSCVLWVSSPTLCGWHIWGRPDEAETRTILQLMNLYVKMDNDFGIIADSRGIEVVNPTALPILAQWVFQNRKELQKRVSVQANVIRR